MDGRSVLPLPPGMVPSGSREDMRDLEKVENEVDGKKNILKESTLDSEGAVSKREGEGEGAGDAVQQGGTPGKMLHAWGSPAEERRKETTTSELNKSTASPFISTSTPDPHTRGPKLKPTTDQTTPRRVMSPLKRFNKVAPVSGKPTSTPLNLEENTTPLKSSSASLLEQKAEDTGRQRTRERPDSAPQKREDPTRRQQLPIDVNVVVKANQPAPTAAATSTPIYSTVVKKVGNKPAVSERHQDLRAATFGNTSLITVTPTLNMYEPEPSPETSMVISNVGTTSPEPFHTSEVIENDYTATPDPLYSTVEEVDAPSTVGNEVARNPVPAGEVAGFNQALLKQLKKHDDKGNVQLVSIKGVVGIANTETTSFPQGSSGNMHALHYAAASGDKKLLAEKISELPISQDTVEMLLGTERLVAREGIDVVDSEGRSPLMHAAHNNQLQAVKMLAESGANVNITAADGSTPLHQAAFNGSIEMVALLLSLGADGLSRDFEGRTPLHWCTNNPNTKCIEILLDKVPGLDINIRDGAHMTALMWAAFHGRTEQLRVLLEKGADPSLRDMDGMAAVHWSVQRHDTRALQVLINSESVEYVDKKGKTVMHQAAEQGSAKAVSLIKAVKPTSVNDLDENGRTPLHWATVCENPEVMRALIHHGSDPGIRDFSGKTALEYSTEKGLHYCGLILTKSEDLASTDDYHSFLTYGSASATVGFRALNHQEGQVLDLEQIKDTLSQQQLMQVKTVCTGSWIYKFTNNGKGPLHPRYFWVNPSNLKICWAKSRNVNEKNTKSDMLVGARSSASPAIYGRRDFDPLDKHKFAFTIFTSNRVLDAVAVSSEDYKLWIDGLQLVLHLGSVNTTKLMSHFQNASGAEPKPIT